LPNPSSQKSGKKSKLLNFAFKLLSYRPRSINEITFRLKRKQATTAEIDSIIKKLIKLDFLNDSEFVLWWQRGRDQFKPRSARILKLELYKKGVPRDIIDAVIDTSSVTELKRARLAVDKKKLSPVKDRDKLIRYLSSRGFNWDIVKQTIDQSSKPE